MRKNIFSVGNKLFHGGSVGNFIGQHLKKYRAIKKGGSPAASSFEHD
jgi:hypothetical protein